MLFILECIGVVHFGLLWPDFVLLFFAFPFAKVRNRKFRYWPYFQVASLKSLPR
jgi:hypothetical protein